MFWTKTNRTWLFGAGCVVFDVRPAGSQALKGTKQEALVTLCEIFLLGNSDVRDEWIEQR